MRIAAIFLAGSLSHLQPVDMAGEPYSIETNRRYEAYGLCLARGAYGRRSDAGSPEAHMKEAKAACRTQYDSFVASAVKDSAGLPDAASAAAHARALLDEVDAKAVIGPPSPAALAHLPVEGLVGAWRLGDGPLAVHMNVRFEDDGSLVGILNPPQDFTSKGLEKWRVQVDAAKEAVLRAWFDGRVAEFQPIPSFPSEMSFINPADPAIQRFDLAVEDEDLLIRVVTTGGGTQLRFRRDLGTARGVARD